MALQHLLEDRASSFQRVSPPTVRSCDEVANFRSVLARTPGRCAGIADELTSTAQSNGVPDQANLLATFPSTRGYSVEGTIADGVRSRVGRYPVEFFHVAGIN